MVYVTGLCGLFFSVCSIQPLTTLGVTGLFSVLAGNVYDFCINSLGAPFLSFMACSLIHAGWTHWLLAFVNAHDWAMRYVTTFSADLFSLLNSIIYLHEAIQKLQRAFNTLSFAAFLCAIIGAVGRILAAIFLSTAESWKPLFHCYLRIGLKEYAAAISIPFFYRPPACR